MYKIRKLFKFEMAHRLSSCYSSECKQWHGHSYTLEVIIKSISLNADGMVIDFKRLKEIVDNRILTPFDHKMLVHNFDGVAAFQMDKDVIEIGYNPTAENMARDFYNRLRPALIKSIRSFVSLEIILHETDTGYASYTNTTHGRGTTC